MSQSIADTLAKLETPTTDTFERRECTHYTATPTAVKRMGTEFTGGIRELAEGSMFGLEMQSCQECQPEEWEAECQERAHRKTAQSAQTSGSNTPTSLADGFRGPVIFNKDPTVTPWTLQSDERSKKTVGCFSLLTRLGK